MVNAIPYHAKFSISLTTIKKTDIGK